MKRVGLDGLGLPSDLDVCLVAIDLSDQTLIVATLLGVGDLAKRLEIGNLNIVPNMGNDTHIIELIGRKAIQQRIFNFLQGSL